MWLPLLENDVVKKWQLRVHIRRYASWRLLEDAAAYVLSSLKFITMVKEAIRIHGVSVEDVKERQDCLAKMLRSNVSYDYMRLQARLHGNAAGMPYDVSETRGNGGETSPREGEMFLQLWYADPYLGNVWGNVSGLQSHVSYVWFEMLALDLEEEIRMHVGTKLTQSSLDFSFRRKPRGGIEQEQYEALLVQVQDVNLVPVSDRWKWSLENSGDFSVASVRKMLDDKMLPDVTTKTRWIKLVPIKVNVHAWKVKIDSLPTRFNISRRGMDIESITCSICDNEVESSSHLFFKCNMVRDIIRKITLWWDITYIEADSYEDWLNWLVNLRLSSNYKQALEGVFYVMWWHVWQYRNKYIFEAVSSPKAMIFEDIVSRSFYWCRNRCKASFSWNDWLKNPYLVAL
ncbi:RNA-directed DNA polymerase, eukaryota [Tanacetum coccineum]|uniref:RNA-directed DNA polymerase, eukaryota n=1 Tax=Tanacetum coccineum TaxID=301880 RepID=A0ABQ4WCR4_9ASTR